MSPREMGGLEVSWVCLSRLRVCFASALGGFEEVSLACALDVLGVCLCLVCARVRVCICVSVYACVCSLSACALCARFCAVSCFELASWLVFGRFPACSCWFARFRAGSCLYLLCGSVWPLVGRTFWLGRFPASTCVLPSFAACLSVFCGLALVVRAPVWNGSFSS